MAATETTTEQWDQTLLMNPHAAADKRARVRRMFTAIAPSYDLNNRLHSLWLDQWWRRKAVHLAAPGAADIIIDVACGTGDLALLFAKRISRPSAATIVGPSTGRVVGLDFTFEMLPLARIKCEAKALRIIWVNGDAQSLPIPDGSADVVSIAFGIRNVADPAAAIGEFHRILRPGGRLVILEFSLPANSVLRWVYNFYFRKILPRTATWISGDKTGAYRYLPESVNTFVSREQMVQMMRNAGFERVEQFPMTFGVCLCYRGFKTAQ